MKWNVLLLSLPAPLNRQWSSQLPFPPEQERKRRTGPGRAPGLLEDQQVSFSEIFRQGGQSSRNVIETPLITMELHFTLKLSVTALILSQVTAFSPANTFQQLRVRIEDHVTSKDCNRTLSELEVSLVYISPVM